MNILLALDHSSCSQAAVTALCEGYRAEHAVVRILHVVEWPHRLPTAFTFAEGAHAAECILDAHRDLLKSAEELVARAASQLRAAGFGVTTHVIEGEVRDLILAMAVGWPADTIVLGSHGRRGLDRLLLGSVSDSVVRQAPCSVVVIREGNETRDPTSADARTAAKQR